MAKNLLPDLEGRRRLINRVIFTAVVLALLVGWWGIRGALWSTGGRSADAYIERARTEMSTNDVYAAMIEAMNAVEAERDNIAARLLLGRIHLESGNPFAAEREIARARELGAARGDWIEPLSEAWLAQQKYDHVLQEIRVTGVTDQDLYAQIVAAHGGAYLGKGAQAVALERFGTALRADPDNVRALLGLARIALSNDQSDKAREYLARANAAAPERLAILRLEGQIAAHEGDHEDAVEAYRALVRKLPHSLPALHDLARSYIAADRVPDAVTLLGRALEQNPQDLTARFLRASAAYRAGDYESARDDAELVLSIDPHHAPSLFLSSGAAFALGKLEQAEARLEQLVKAEPASVPARRLLGATYLRLGKDEQAREILESLEGEEVDDASSLTLLGGAALGTGNLVDAERYLAKASSEKPDSAELLAELGTVRIRLGDVDRGVDDLEKAWSLSAEPRSKAPIMLVQTHLKRGDVASAVDVIKRLRAEDPESALADILSGFVHLQDRDIAQARESFRAALRKNPTAPDAVANAASLEVVAGDRETAKRLLREGLEATNGEPGLIRQLAAIEAQTGEAEMAIRRLVALNDERPEMVSSRVLLARILLDAGRLEEAEATAAQALALAHDHLQAIAIAGDVDLARGKSGSAAERFSRLVTLAPNSFGAHLRLAQAHRAAGRGDLAARHLAKAVELRPSDRGALALLARVQIERERFADAGEAIDRLRTMVPPEDPRLIQLQTSLAVAEGRMGDAAALYARHFASSPSSGVAARLAVLQHSAGDTDGALATLADWVADHPADVPVLKAMGDLAASDGRWSVAADQYRAVLDVAPDDASARNNLAFSLWKAGRAQEALPEAERALSLDPTNPNVLDTLGLVYVSTGRIEDGIALIQQAVEDQPANPGYRYHLAWARSQAGEPAAAREILDLVLAENPDFPEREEALALLEQLGR